MPNLSAPATTVSQTALRRLFWLIAAGVGMTNLDLFVVNVAMPDIAKDFAGAGLDALSWILTGYAMAFAACLIPAGNYADGTGVKRAYLLGLSMFTLASAACALSPGVWWLVAARIVQAVGAALLTPASLGLILSLFPGAARGAAIRNWAATAGLAAALGPVLGGVLAHWHWRFVFWINVPVGAVVLMLGARAIPAATRPHAQRHAAALPDAVLFALTTATFALAVLKVNEWGWQSRRMILACAVLVVALLAALLRARRKTAAALPGQLLNIPGLKARLWGNALFALAFGIMLLSISLWLQQVWQWGALGAGLAIFPGPCMVPALSPLAGRLASRIGAPKLAAIGCALFGAGLAWWIGTLRADHADYFYGVLPGLLLTGVGVCFTMPTLIGAAVSVVPAAHFSTGAAIVTVARQIGTVMGVAGLVTLLDRYGGVRVAQGYRAGWWLALAATGLTAGICALTRGRRAR